MVLALDESDVRADIELVLVLAYELEEHVLLLDEAELVLLFEILVLDLVDAEARWPRLLNLIQPCFSSGLADGLILLVREDGIQEVLLSDVLADLHVLVALLLQSQLVGLVVARNQHREVKVAQRVQEEHLELRVVLQLQIVDSGISLPDLLPRAVHLFLVDVQAASVVHLPQDVAEEHGDRNRNQVLEDERRRYGQVAHRNELCLLGVEVDVASDAVGVRVEHQEYLVVVLLEASVLSKHLGFQDDGLLLKDLLLLLQEGDIGLDRPFKLLVATSGVQRPTVVDVGVAILDWNKDWPHLDLSEAAGAQRNDGRRLWLDDHLELHCMVTQVVISADHAAMDLLVTAHSI